MRENWDKIDRVSANIGFLIIQLQRSPSNTTRQKGLCSIIANLLRGRERKKGYGLIEKVIYYDEVMIESFGLFLMKETLLLESNELIILKLT